MTKEQIKIEILGGRGLSTSHYFKNAYLKTVLECMDIYADQQTATFFTFEEVQKIVENVREACSQIPDSKYDYANILKIDLNQFIKKL